MKVSKGKNFSGNSNKNRSKSDFYQTPVLMAKDLQGIIDRHARQGYLIDTSNHLKMLDPCCGLGSIRDGLRGYINYSLTEFDLYPSQKYPVDSVDFLSYNTDERFDLVVSNPPFKLAYEFIQKGLEVADKVIYLLPLSYLHGKKRLDDLYSKGHLEAVYVYCRYPMLTNTKQEGLYNTGMMVYAWYVFSRGPVGRPPFIYWLDNNHHIARQGDS